MCGRARAGRGARILTIAGAVLGWSSNASATEPGRPATPDGPAQPGSGSGDSGSDYEVIVQGNAPERERRLTHREARRLPGAFGDPLRAIEMLPGVSPTNSGLPYFYVRGAPPGNVGYFLDGVRVPQLFHLAVGPSVLHPALIDGVTLHAGPYPARYGRFAGGVVEAETAPPVADLGGAANLRVVDAGALAHAPLDEYRGYAALAGRYSYTGPIVGLIVPEIDVSYWDYQALASYDLTERDTVGLLAFGASDFLSERRETGRKTLFDAEFHRTDLRYDRRLEGGSRLRVAVTLGDDQTRFAEGMVTVKSRSTALRSELSAPLAGAGKLRAGADGELSRYTLVLFDDPDSSLAPGALVLPALILPSRDDVTAGAWLDLELEVARGVKLRPGVRVDLFNSSATTRVAVDPRLLADFEVNERLSIQHGLGLSHQRPGFAIPLPGAQPVLDELQQALQASSGARLRLPEDVEASLTGFVALHTDLTDPIASARVAGGSLVEEGSIAFREPERFLGRSYGLELLVQRSLARRLGGYLAYTLSRSERSRGVLRIPSPFDRTHVFGAAVGYDFGRGWQAGVRGSVHSGVPANVAYPGAARSPPRTPPFWRLDWRVEKSWALSSRSTLSLVFEVLNTTLNRQVIRTSCSAYVCKDETFAPVTVPSIGLEARF